MSRTYFNPSVLPDMVKGGHWVRSVTYHDDDTVTVECGRWGGPGWIRFTENYAASEFPEAVVSAKYRLEQAA